MTGLEGLCLTIHSNRAKYTSIAESWELLYDFWLLHTLTFRQDIFGDNMRLSRHQDSKTLKT